MMSRQEHRKMIEEIQSHDNSRLSKWELDFIDSMRSQIESGEPLTVRQILKLEQVWEKVFSHRYNIESGEYEDEFA